MKILVMSDSHGNTGICTDIILKYLDQVDMFVHLGDGEREFNMIMEMYDKKYISVKGNCDDYCNLPAQTEFMAENIRFFATHGNDFNVKISKDALRHYIESHDYKAGLFGHTHKPYYEENSGRFLINPGSISKGFMKVNTFCVLDVENGEIEVSYYSCDNFEKIDISDKSLLKRFLH